VRADRGFGEVQNRHVQIPAADQRLTQPGNAAANIDDRIGFGRASSLDPAERAHRLGFVPTDF
jgi:hypothetical protein